LDESIRNTLVSYTPPKEMVNSSFEKMYEDELKILCIHVVYAPIALCDNEHEFRKSGRKKEEVEKSDEQIGEDERKNDKKD